MRTLSRLFLLAMMGFTLQACDKDNGFENAGEQIDEAAEEIGDEIDDATDDTP